MMRYHIHLIIIIIINNFILINVNASDPLDSRTLALNEIKYINNTNNNCDAHIIVLVCTRAKPLERLCDSIKKADYLNKKISLNIVIDIKTGEKQARNDVVNIANKVIKDWKYGPSQVIIQKGHIGIIGMWIDVWRPNKDDNNKGFAIILEDDLQVSPHYFRWYWNAHHKWSNNDNVVGFAGQRPSLRAKGGSGPIDKEVADIAVVSYPLIATWGFSPVNKKWYEFRQWFHQWRTNKPKELPLVPGLTPSGWYSTFAQQNKAHSMWSMWFIRFCNDGGLSGKIKPYQIIYATPKNGESMVCSWAEPGLHYKGPKAGRSCTPKLLTTWDKRLDLNQLPLYPQKINWDGSLIQKEQGSLIQQEEARIQYNCKICNQGYDEHMKVVQAARSVQQQYKGWTLIILLTSAFIEMTASWICNVGIFKNVLAYTLFVCTDKETEEQLKSLKLPYKLNTVVWNFNGKGSRNNLQYGHVGYYHLMLARTCLLSVLLEHHVNVFVAETDAVWFDDALEKLLITHDQSNNDIIAYNDNAYWGAPHVGGGFLLLNSTKKTCAFWKDVTEQYCKLLTPHLSKSGTADIGDLSEQQLLNKMMLSHHKNIQWTFMNKEQYPSGQYYCQAAKSNNIKQIKEMTSKVIVLQNNWILGNDQKKIRAIDWNHWFLKDNKCTIFKNNDRIVVNSKLSLVSKHDHHKKYRANKVKDYKISNYEAHTQSGKTRETVCLDHTIMPFLPVAISSLFIVFISFKYISKLIVKMMFIAFVLLITFQLLSMRSEKDCQIKITPQVIVTTWKVNYSSFNTQDKEIISNLNKPVANVNKQIIKNNNLESIVLSLNEVKLPDWVTNNKILKPAYTKRMPQCKL